MRRSLRVAAAAAWISILLAGAPAAAGHPAGPPPAPAEPPRVVEEISPEDVERYSSQVNSIRPRVSGLQARIVDGQDKLELTWTGREPLVVEGYRGEPMVRMSSAGVEINRRSPSAYLSTHRYAAVTVPARADAAAPPDWRLIDTPGPISWYDHRTHWMRSERPAAVGDSTRALTIFHWRVPARLGAREMEIRGGLDWRPDPAAVRAERSGTSRPLLAAALLALAAVVGAALGVAIRGRLEARTAA